MLEEQGRTTEEAERVPGRGRRGRGLKGPRGKGATGDKGGLGWWVGIDTGRRWRGRDRSRELASPSANFITELVVFAQIISIYSTQAGNLFASECMREWNLPRSPSPPMCGSRLSSRAIPCSPSMNLPNAPLANAVRAATLIQLFKEILEYARLFPLVASHRFATVSYALEFGFEIRDEDLWQ